MQQVLEHYGMGLLGLFAVTGIIAIVFGCIGDGGVLSNIVADYMAAICG